MVPRQMSYDELMKRFDELNCPRGPVSAPDPREWGIEDLINIKPASEVAQIMSDYRARKYSTQNQK